MPDMSGTIGRELEAAVARAEKLAKEGDVAGAKEAYLKASQLAFKYAQSSGVSAIKKQRLDRAKALQALAEKAVHRKVHTGGGKAPPGDKQDLDTESADREQVRRLIARSNVTWDQIAGLEECKEELIASYAMAVARQPEGANLTPNRNVLLYGPPGTGKTLLAAAVSNSLDATFFSVNTGDLLSSLYGKSSQLIAAVFKEAAACAPSVVFLDEIDALVPSRDKDISAVDTRVVSAFLQAVDGFSGKADAPFVFTMAATNKPWQLDNAMLSRFGRMVYVPLPDRPCRAKVFELNLKAKGIPTELTCEQLADLTDGYSGREISKLCQQAVTLAIREHNPNLRQKADLGKEALQQYQLELKSVSSGNFREAMKKIKPVSDAVALRRFGDWAQAQGG